MQIVCVSRGSLSAGRELADNLAAKLGYPVLSREKLIEEATHEGIQVGKLETAMMNPRAFTERLARERDHYLAFCTSYLCDRLEEGPLVYHGRTGHLLLRGISHVLRVRVVADEEYRIASVMRELGLEREKARAYLKAVEEDRRNWTRAMYGASSEEAEQYDVVVNIERMSVGNAAASLVDMCQLPDFQATPASRRAMEDLRVSARARLLLARDPRTNRFGFSVGTHDGVLTVTFLPHDAEVAPHIEPVLQPLAGVDEIRATMAATTILWVQEAFDPASDTFRDVVEIAGKWNAAVELVRYTADAAGRGGHGPGAAAPVREAVAAGGVVDSAATAATAAGAGGAGAATIVAPPIIAAAPGGIEEDVDEEPAVDEGLKATLDALARLGRAGGARHVRGSRGSLIASCCGGVPHSMVVLGELFLGSPHAARLRLTRELRGSISDRVKVPVVTTDELRTQYLFGHRDLFRLLGWVAVVLALYVVAFTHQPAMLRFLASGGDALSGTVGRLLVSAAVFVFVPIVAFSYGTVARLLMKLIRME